MKQYLLIIAYAAHFLTFVAFPLAAYPVVLAASTIPAREFFYDVELPDVAEISVYDAMLALSGGSDFTFQAKSHPSLGYFIYEIQGIRNANGFYWTLYINGTYSLVGASFARVRPGDVIDWKYEKK